MWIKIDPMYEICYDIGVKKSLMEVIDMAIVKITEANFEQEVLKSDKKVLIDFWASWCGPCRMLGPVIEEIAAEREDIKVCKVDVDSEGALAQSFRVVSIPMLVVMEDGKVVNKSVGFIPKEQVLDLLK